ncbi:MAG: small heat shock protein [Planctomycetaceae bacterium]|nr:small heat shock protein [Planctomycetaceae bacterium]
MNSNLNATAPHSTNRCHGHCETRKGHATEERSASKVFVPQVDIVESDDRITLVADLPGVDQETLDISVEKNVLSLRGTVKPNIPEGYQLAYSEFEVGNFERSFTISNDIDRAGIEAVMKDGVLRLTLPKAQHAMLQKIPVKTVS